LAGPESAAAAPGTYHVIIEPNYHDPLRVPRMGAFGPPERLMMTKLLQGWLCGLLLAMATCAGAAGWPERPIRLVVPYPAGGYGDIVARILADGLRPKLGPIIVENRTGAGGNIGMELVARSQADGYTFVFAPANNFVSNQYIYPSLPFDPLADLAPVSIVIDVPSVLFVNPRSKARTLGEFAGFVRSHPGTMNYGSPGAGTLLHLTSEAINRALDLRMTHIAYRGAPEAIRALLAGDIQMMVVAAGVGLPQVHSGRLRAIAVSGTHRVALLPDTPTFAEAGLTTIKGGNWWGIAAPRGTPPDVISRFYRAAADVLSTAKAQKQLQDLGAVPVLSSPDAAARRIDEEAQYWKARLREWKVTVG
jgi:tripartite-type tricarboxylate transporter receptor subunit TctC